MKKYLDVKYLPIILIFILSVIAGCQEEILGPVTSNANQPELDFLIGDPFNPLSVDDTVGVNQPTVFTGRSTLAGITSWTWDFGDGVQDSGQVVTHKFTTPGTYTVCLRVWFNNNQSQVYCRDVRVGYTLSSKPIFKKISAVNVGNGNWEVTYGLLRYAVLQMNCNISQPFIVFSEISGWNAYNIPNPNDTTVDGYWKYKETVSNYSRRGFSYGGHFPDCYAWIAPHQNFSNSYYNQDSGKMFVTWVDGEAVPDQNINNLEPGMVGDHGANAVCRIGLSPYSQDTIVFYFPKARVTGSQSSPFWVNSISGMTNPKPLTTTSGFPLWWRAAIHKNSLPSNGFIAFKYGGQYSSSWANMSGSYFWNSTNSYLEAVVIGIGGTISITNPPQL